jgi:hypothetical protein
VVELLLLDCLLATHTAGQEHRQHRRRTFLYKHIT